MSKGKVHKEGSWQEGGGKGSKAKCWEYSELIVYMFKIVNKPNLINKGWRTIITTS